MRIEPVFLAMFPGDGDVAPIAGEVVPGGQRDQPLPGIAAAGNARLHPAVQPFEVLLHDEVDHAADRIRAIDRRGAAGQHFHPVDQVFRNGVDIDRLQPVGRTDMPSPVDQHQCPVIAKVAQIEQVEPGVADPCAVAAVVVAAGRSDQRGQGLEIFGHIGRARFLQPLGIDRDHRVRRRRFGGDDARSGHDNRRAVLVGRSRRWRGLGLRRSGKDHGNGGNACRSCKGTHGANVHDGPALRCPAAGSGAPDHRRRPVPLRHMLRE